jgi:putative ATP-dependent endonuclease of the OLD family
MILTLLRIQNYRSIVDSGDIHLEQMQSFVGENNCGKSNILRALQVFLTAGAGGVTESDYFDSKYPIVISISFSNLSDRERRLFRPYMLEGSLSIEKHISLEVDPRVGNKKPKTEYHGYQSTPRDWWLSIEGVIAHEGKDRPNWREVAQNNGILQEVQSPDGSVTKSTYEAGLKKILFSREDIVYEEPQLGQTQTLGLQPVLLDALPQFRMLPAITDYSDEIDKRASQTSFRLLMADLSERIISKDPRYGEIQKAISSISQLLNPPTVVQQAEDGQDRLAVMQDVENSLTSVLSRLMPSVVKVSLSVDVEKVDQIFSRGVALLIDDGRLTEVLVKGHGMQRCVVFALIQSLVLCQRGQLAHPTVAKDIHLAEDYRNIILAVEEPELYIHPQMQRMIYSAMADFAETDQVIYSSHSPAFVDIGHYESIALVRKSSVAEGTKVTQCPSGTLDQKDERKQFQFVNSFGLEQNNMFFARRIILVEGPEDIIAILAVGRKIGLFREFPEELGVTIIKAGCKQEIPKFMKVLNAFRIPYAVLLELDGKPGSPDNNCVRGLLGPNRAVELDNRLEDAVGHAGHFGRTYDAQVWFERDEAFTEKIRSVVASLCTA